nr:MULTISPECIES: PTS lactose/cellobiose transporter subunit IIA [Anaerostipes]
MMEGVELICFQIITAAGGAKSAYMEAVNKAKEGLYDEARAMIEEGDKMLKEGHGPHTDLIQQEAASNESVISLILAHAEDQMMSAEVFKMMAEQVIDLYEKIDTLSK